MLKKCACGDTIWHQIFEAHNFRGLVIHFAEIIFAEQGRFVHIHAYTTKHFGSKNKCPAQ